MDFYYKIFYDLLQYLLKSSFMATIVVLLILLIRILLNHKLGVRLQYSLWFILILRLIVPTAPASNLSIYNYVSPLQQYSSNYVENITSSDINTNSDTYEKMNIKNPYFLDLSIPKAHSNSHKQISIIILWALGVSIYLSVILFSYTKLLSSLKNSSEVKNENIVEILNQCKRNINIAKKVTLIETNLIKTPVLLGYIKPKILIPTDLLNFSNHNHLRYTLLHELSHIKRKDILINYICSILSVVYWFNPLIWYGFHKMREDRELCCDSLALSFINDKEVYEYGHTIIKLAELSSRAPWLPGMAGIINNKSKIKRRIIMIKLFKRNSYKLSIVPLTLLILVSFISLTDAKAASPNNETSISAEGSTKPTQIVFDKIDYPFINDEQLIGKWEAVDFIFKLENFDPNRKFWDDNLYFKSMTILPNGEIEHPISSDFSNPPKGAVKWLTWTKDYIIHHGDTTASQYTIQEINGTQYMFMEWKSGDYTITGNKPYYYVLKKVA